MVRHVNNEKSAACSMARNRGSHIRIHAQDAGNRRFGMHVQLFSHMHGVEASGPVGLFVRTKAIIPNFICHNIYYMLIEGDKNTLYAKYTLWHVCSGCSAFY